MPLELFCTFLLLPEVLFCLFLLHNYLISGITVHNTDSPPREPEERPYYSRKLKLSIGDAVKKGMSVRTVVEKFKLRNRQVVYNILKWCRHEGSHGLTVQWLVDYLNSGCRPLQKSSALMQPNNNGFVKDEEQSQSFDERNTVTAANIITQACDNLKTVDEFRLNRQNGGIRLDPTSAAPLRKVLSQCEIKK